MNYIDNSNYKLDRYTITEQKCIILIRVITNYEIRVNT